MSTVARAIQNENTGEPGAPRPDIPPVYWNVGPEQRLLDLTEENPRQSAVVTFDEAAVRRDIAYFARLMAENNPEEARPLADYAAFHLARFVESLRLVPRGSAGERILELGAFYPLTAAIYRNLGYDEVRCTDFRPATEDRPRIDRDFLDVRQNLTLRLRPETLNLDTDDLPYPDGYFASVLCLETLEHLTLDPMRMMSEINRVLKTGGVLVLSTPNVVSAHAVACMLRGEHPCGSNQYPKSGYLSMRHNREYAPAELQLLCTAAGFEVCSLSTPDVWERTDPATIEKIRSLGYSTDLRGACIMCLARKTHGVRERYPREFYV